MVHPKTLTAREFQDVSFQCRATGSPSPTVRWTRRGQVWRHNERQTSSVIELCDKDSNFEHVISTMKFFLAKDHILKRKLFLVILLMHSIEFNHTEATVRSTNL